MVARSKLRGVVAPPSLADIGPLVRAIYGVTSEKCVSGRAYVQVRLPLGRLRPDARRAWDNLYRATSLRHTDDERSDASYRVEDLVFRNYDPRGGRDAARALSAFAWALHLDHAAVLEARVPSFALFPDHPWEERVYPPAVARERQWGIAYLCEHYHLDPAAWEECLSALYARRR